jgi:hypothetical protein
VRFADRLRADLSLLIKALSNLGVLLFTIAPGAWAAVPNGLAQSRLWHAHIRPRLDIMDRRRRNLQTLRNEG